MANSLKVYRVNNLRGTIIEVSAPSASEAKIEAKKAGLRGVNWTRFYATPKYPAKTFRLFRNHGSTYSTYVF